jgi:hypothetical protein
MALTPFELTLLIDSDTIACMDFSNILTSLSNVTTLDFAVFLRSEKLEPQNGVMLYRSGTQCFMSLRRLWYIHYTRQLHHNSESKDDQYSLMLAIRDLETAKKTRRGILDRCQIYSLPAEFNLVLEASEYMSGRRDSNRWVDNVRFQTYQVKSDVYIVHANRAHAFAKEICALVNKQAVPRVITYSREGAAKYPNDDLSLQGYNVSYSFDECDRQLAKHCSQKSYQRVVPTDLELKRMIKT